MELRVDDASPKRTVIGSHMTQINALQVVHRFVERGSTLG
jgi:hypothetical protein